eukprot:3590831-Pleurochrysis_carterae.AAC.1
MAFADASRLAKGLWNGQGVRYKVGDANAGQKARRQRNPDHEWGPRNERASGQNRQQESPLRQSREIEVSRGRDRDRKEETERAGKEGTDGTGHHVYCLLFLPCASPPRAPAATNGQHS